MRPSSDNSAAGVARHFALVPAAGAGQRMGGQRPKQYLPLLGRPLIYHALAVLCGAAALRRVYVVLDVADTEWGRHDWSALGPGLKPLFCGGASRAETVRKGLRAIAGELQRDDWVLVHDAARPCLASWQLAALMGAVGESEVGGLLAVPVADTLKRADDRGHIAATIDRHGLWQAQTPQMFRYHLLRGALEGAREVTDESSAIEALGLKPLLVAADGSNLKVTYPFDLQLAEWILKSRECAP